MKKQKHYLHLTSDEYHLMIKCLLDFRNKLISKGRYTDAVDEIIINHLR